MRKSGAADTNRPPVLACTGLAKSFDGIHALEGVSLRLRGPSITAIIGPNGAGKTTLVNVWSGFVPTDAGMCFVGNKETTNWAPHDIARIGLARTFQDVRLIEQETTLNNVMLAQPNQKGEKLFWALFRIGVADEERANFDSALKWLRFVGLESKAGQLAGELSFGEQKLLTLACCLVTPARILLLDEPLAGVHPEMAEKVFALLAQLRSGGKLIVFIEHDISAVRRIADHVIVMDAGRIIAEGSPADVLERPEILEAYVA